MEPLKQLLPRFHIRIFVFIIACFSGFLLAYVWHQYVITIEIARSLHQPFAGINSNLRDTKYEQWFKSLNMNRKILTEEDKSFGTENKLILKSEASFLHNKTSVLCIIIVTFGDSVRTINQSWAQHCNKALFFGVEQNDNIHVKNIDDMSYKGFCQLYNDIRFNHSQKYKWIFISNEKTYAIIENLRYYVAPLNSSLPYYLGHPVKTFAVTYNSGEAGIVLSWQAWKLLETEFNTNNSCNSFSHMRERIDQLLGDVLRKYGILPRDTRDLKGRGRFIPFPLEGMLFPGKVSIFNSYWSSSLYPYEEGANCCSPQAITFGGYKNNNMHILEYFFYSITPFKNSFKGKGNKPPPLISDERSKTTPTPGRAIIHPVSISSKT